MNSDERIIDGLSHQLREDVLLYLYKDLLSSKPFFATRSTHFILETVQVLRLQVHAPEEFVITEVRFRLRASRSSVSVAAEMDVFVLPKSRRRRPALGCEGQCSAGWRYIRRSGRMVMQTRRTAL